MKKLMVIAFAIFMYFVGFATSTNTCFQALAALNSKAIQAIEVPASQLGENFKLVKSFYVESEQLKQFATKFGAKLVSLKNDIFVSTDGTRVQINYIEAVSPEDAQKVYENMVNMVGYVNVVMLKNKVVIEVISNQVGYKEAAIKHIKPDKVHKNY